MPKDVTNWVAEHSVNLPVDWRHQSPLKKKFRKQPVLGTIVDAKEQDGQIYIKPRIDAIHPFQQEKRDWIIDREKKGEGVGASISVNLLGSESDISKGYALGWAITPKPECNTCFLEGQEMPDEKEKEQLEAEKKELETKLGDKDSALTELETKYNELDDKFKTLEAARTAVDTEVKEKEISWSQEKEGYETRLKEAESKLSAIEERELNSRLTRLEELETKADWEFLKDSYPSMPVKKLDARIDCLEKRLAAEAPPIITEDVEETRTKEQEKTPKQLLETFQGSKKNKALLAKRLGVE
jgi:uncharacterized protein YdcH (DUF465 family)